MHAHPRAGCLSVNDILREVAQATQGGDAAVPTPDQLKAIGAALCTKPVSAVDHDGELWLLNIARTTSLLDLLNSAFDINGTHAHHRVYLAAPAGEVHEVDSGPIEALNVVQPSSAALKVTHVLSLFDLVVLLNNSIASLGDLGSKTVEQLELDAGAVLCVDASTPALLAFQRMAVEHKSALGLVDASGKLVGNVSGAAAAVQQGGLPGCRFGPEPTWHLTPLPPPVLPHSLRHPRPDRR